MSLHIGNLLPHTRRDELEHVFQKFGQCDVRLKDGYGFVVYDSPPNAEKALRALQGRNICGQPLTLTWSNKQPRSFKRFAKAVRSYEPLSGSFPRGGRDYSNRKLHSNAVHDYRLHLKQSARNSRKLTSADMLDEDRSYHGDSIKGYTQEEHCDYREDMLDEGRNVEPHMMDNDRWGEQFHDETSDDSVENGVDFEQNERYQGYDTKGEDENHLIAYSGVSLAPRSSQEVLGREHLSEAHLDPPHDSKLLQTCYNCGGSGHKMRNCSRANASCRKFMRVGCRHGDGIERTSRGEGKLEKYGSSSHGKLQSNRDSMSMSQLGDGRKVCRSGRHRKLMRNGYSSRAKGTEKVQKKDHGGKRRSRRDFGTLSEKKAKSSSSPLNSDYTQSRSQSTSRSPKPDSRYRIRSRSRSGSSRVHSSSSDSRSSSKSHYTGSFNPKSKSRSSSHASLSKYPGQPVQTLPTKVQQDLKGPLDTNTIIESEEILVEQGPLVNDTGLESAKLENNMSAMQTKNAVSSYNGEDKMDKNRSLQRNEIDSHIPSMSLCEVTNPSTSSLSEKIILPAESLSLETLEERKVHQNSDSSLVVHHSETLLSSCPGHSVDIPSGEMYMVMKHYGLDLPGENERHLPVEDYFGSARLWPWEIIYYRRWKRGPISTKSYSKQ